MYEGKETGQLNKSYSYKKNSDVKILNETGVKYPMVLVLKKINIYTENGH